MSSTESTARGPAAFEEPVAAAASGVASFEEGGKSPLKHMQHFLHAHPTMIPFIVLLLGVLLFSALVGGRFFTPFNLSLILQQVTIIGVIGIAQTLIVLTAGIDLSVGAIMVLSSVIMGRMAIIGLPGFGLGPVPYEITFVLGLMCGLACGAINGALVSYVKLPPFIVTLGTWLIFGALNLAYSQSETIRQQDIAAVAGFLQFTGQLIPLDKHWLGGAQITNGSILMVGLAAAVWYMLNRTAFGRHIYATGDDEEAARLAGIRTDRTLVTVYALAGLICAIGAWVLIGRIGSISPQAGQTANLDSITAVVIGGTSLFGGRGSIVGTLVGALIVGVFRNGLALYGVDVLWQEFTVGLLIIIAVAIDQWIRKVSA